MEISSSLKFSLDADMDVEKCENAVLSLDFIFPTSKQKEMRQLSKDKGTFWVSL